VREKRANATILRFRSRDAAKARVNKFTNTLNDFLMKKLLLFTIIVIVSYLIACFKLPVEEQNQNSKVASQRSSQLDLLDLLGTSCTPDNIFDPSGSGCNDKLNVETLTLNNLPQYPGCTFKVTFKWLICDGGSLVDLTVGDFQILEHNCPQFSEDIKDKWNQTVFSEFIQDFETSVWNSIETHFIAKYMTPGKFNCGQGAFLNINYIRASCAKYACTLPTFETFEQPLGICTKIACGSECCPRATKICRKADGTLNIETEYDPFVANCGAPAFLNNPELPEPFKSAPLIGVTPCFFFCPL
jgi:hypothetical protein